MSEDPFCQTLAQLCVLEQFHERICSIPCARVRMKYVYGFILSACNKKCNDITSDSINLKVIESRNRMRNHGLTASVHYVCPIKFLH